MFRNILTLSATAAALIAPSWAQETYTSDHGSGGIEMVTVTASPLHQHLDDTPSITAQLSRDDILTSGGGNLADALANIPGISGSGFAAGASRPVIRGMDSNRVKLVENGLSSSDVSDIGPDHGVPLDPLSTQSIEVVRGAATLRYGSQAIGGVVNAINNRVPTALPATDFSGEATASYASVANTGEGSLMADGAIGKFALHADAFYRNAGDYDTPLGRQDNSFFVGNGAALGGSYFFGNGNRTGLGLIQYDAKYGIPSDTAFILMRQTKFLTRSAFNVDYGPLGTLSIDGVYANYSHEEKNPDGSVNTTFKNKELDARAEQLIGAVGPFSSAALGFEVQNREYSALGADSSYLFPAITNTMAGYLFSDLPLRDGLHAEISGRVENVRISGTPASGIKTTRDFTPLSAAAGLLWEVNGWLKVGLTASTAGRAPAQTELFARGAHDGPGTLETGDPALKTERANSLEATARIRDQKLTVDFSLWSSWFDNYIYGALTGQLCDEAGVCGAGGDLKELIYRQQGAYFRGIEGKASYKLLDEGDGILSADLQGDIVRATLGGGSNVPRIPPYRIGGGLTWDSDAFDAGVQVMINGRQSDPGQYDTPTPSYTEVNAILTWRPFASAQGTAIELVGHNLTDAVVRNAVSFNKDTIVMPGRDIRLVLRTAF